MRTIKSALPFLLSAALYPASACEMGPLDEPYEEEISPVPLQQGLTMSVIQEDYGRFIAVSGEDCGTSSGSKVTMSGSWSTPAYVNRATVFLNGWHVKYASGDHHVRSIAMQMKNVQFSSAFRIAAWNVEGILGDKKFDDAIQVCYTYTAIGWASSALDARVVSQAGHSGSKQDDDVKHVDLALSASSPFGTAERTAVLPRGFAQAYTAWHGDSAYDPRCAFGFGLDLYCKVDHHVQQLAYHQSQDLDAGSGISWNARSIIHDNDTRHEMGMESSAVVIGGTGVELSVPSYSVESSRSPCGTIGAVQGEKWTEVTVPNLPYDYVVPVLTGWNLQFQCDDEELKRAGVFIKNARYDAATRTLRYWRVEALADEDNAPAFTASTQVVLLGFRRPLALPTQPPPGGGIISGFAP